MKCDSHMKRDLEREGWREGKGGSYRDAYATNLNPLYMEFFGVVIFFEVIGKLYDYNERLLY